MANFKSEYDVIVVGAGHNSLTAAGYLAKAGLHVGVFERNAWVGGGAVTREVTAPGFKHDMHATQHEFIMCNPLILQDELGLQKKFGLKYIQEPVRAGTMFPDGRTLLTHHDVENTAQEIAAFSRADADAYRAFAQKAIRMLPLLIQGLFSPPAPFGTFMAILDQSEEGRELTKDLLRSAYDVINELFENDQVKMHFMKYASEAMMAPEEQGTGLVVHMMMGLSALYPSCLPEGGSGELSHSLVRCIQHYGGDVMTECEVDRLLLSNDRAVGVKLKSGEEIRAKRGVLASVHPYLLDAFTGGKLPEKLKTATRQVKLSNYSAFVTHYALKERPRFSTNIDKAYIMEFMPETMAELRGVFDDLRYGRVPKQKTLAVIISTDLDPTRAPDGNAILWVYNFAPYNLADGGPERWDEIKQAVSDECLDELRKFTVSGLEPENIIAQHVESPLDLARSSPSYQGGDILAAGAYIYQFGAKRPVPELGDYTVPGISDLFLTGPFMHPGGGVIGGGRPTAITMFQKWGMDWDKMLIRQ